MNKQDLLKLEKLAALTPKEIEKKQPALFEKIGELAGSTLKNTIKSRLKDAPKSLKDNLGKIDFSPQKLGNQDVKVLLSKTLLGGRLSAEKKKKIADDLVKVPELGRLDDVLQPDMPILVNPAFQNDLAKARVYRLSNLSGLSQAKTDKALEKGLSLNSISDNKLDELVKDNVITNKEAKEMGLASNLYTLFDADFELTEHVRKIRSVQSLEDLIPLERGDWKKLVSDSKMKLPKELKPDDYAEILYKKVENLFPGKVLVFRTGAVSASAVSEELKTLKPLFKHNPKLFGLNGFDELKTGSLSAAEKKKLKAAHERIDRISKVHPGLKLDDLLNDKNLSEIERGTQLVKRTGLLKQFIKNNPKVNYLTLQYTHDSDDLKALNFQGFSPDEKAMVLNSVKSYQRVYSFTGDVEYTEAIMAAGFHSAYHITSVTQDEFIRAVNLPANVAAGYFENAHMAIIRTTGVMGSILDIITGSFDWTAVGNTGPSVKDYLKKIPGYQELFGELSFCDCDHCQSIYSPAAYFVDLMQFVERYIINKHFTGTKAGHVLNLKVRRPDLWSLPLTCENTTTLVPYLDIINEILEAFIATKKGFTGDLNDPKALGEFVYKKEMALEKPGAWKNNVHAFDQPFHLPLESVSVYLSHFERSPADIAHLLQEPPQEIAKALLNLSIKEFQLITVPDNSPAFLNRVYGITFGVSSGKISPFDAQKLLKPLGVTRKELGRVLKSRFITKNGADNIIIKGEKRDSDSIQNDIERVKNLTFDALDRAHRFVRLWRKTSWSIEELDLVLTQIQFSGAGTGIDPDSVTTIGSLMRLQEKLNLSVEVLSAIWHRIPDMQMKEGEPSLFDALFNHPDVVATEGSYPKNTTAFIHPALIVDQSTAPAEFSSARLMDAFNLSDADVLLLIQHLAVPMGITNIASATEAERGFKLSTANLSLLYRHAQLAAILKLSVGELFQMLQLMSEIPNGYIESISHIFSLIDFHRWWKSTTFTLDDLHFMTESPRVLHPENFSDKEEVTAKVIDQTQESNALLFADTLFAYFDDVTEDQSRAIIAANRAIIEPSPDGTHYWLKPAFNPATAIAVPAGISRPEGELRALLTRYHPGYLIPFQLSGSLGLSESSLSQLIAAMGADLDDDAYTLELQGISDPPVAIPSLVEKLLPPGILFKDKKFDSQVLSWVLAHGSVFEMANVDNLSMETIRKLHSFKQFVTINENGETNIEWLDEVMGSFTAATQFQNANPDKLAAILKTDASLLASIHSVAGSSPNAITALNRLRQIADLCSYIGVGGDVLPKIVSGQYDVLHEAAIALLGAFRGKYPTLEERREKLESYQDKLRGKKRAALTTYLIHSGFPQFENSNDLFHYFLIDTELEGCARTSRLVAATMSLQLYIHRVLLNLEQDDQEPGTAGRVHVQADDIPGDEWDWRKNYRVWEANRKVFLYPENYLEPDLRDNKSPLFEELESELLQQEINADTVMDAYGKYMRGFDEVAHLKIAGSYHEKDEESETDVLHLFGVTADEPPVFYYRKVENIYYSEVNDNRGVVWGPWQKISVQIPVRKVAPVVYNGRLHVFWVKVTTLTNTVFDSDRSLFTGYSHKFSIEFTTLKLDKSWTPPQKLNLKNSPPFSGNGVIHDPLADEAEKGELQNQLHNILRSFPFFNFSGITSAIRDLKTPRYDKIPHYEPVDEYTLSGFLWDQVFPTVRNQMLILTGVGYQMRAAIDFYDLAIQDRGIPFRNTNPDPAQERLTVAFDKPGKILVKQDKNLFRAVSPPIQLFDNYAYGSLVVNALKSNFLLQRHWSETTLNFSFENMTNDQKIATLRAGTSVQIINGAYGDAVIDDQGDLLLLQGTPVEGNGFILKRLGTTLSETLTRTLFTSGVDTTLDIKTQKALKEAAVTLSITNNRIENMVVKDKIDFKGAYGTYYREIFFHIPFLLANHLNSQGKYADAQKWYHYIFNPSATEVIDFSDPALTAEQKKKMSLDRNWQYLEFREIDTQKLRDQLNDKQAIEVYKKDPFNPHAIARLRMSAYQKSIVMKYIDNLLDWGDQLFTRDTMESINEATLLYTIAKEILGKPPAESGSCGEGKIAPKSYEKIKPLLNKGSEFLAELEHYTFVKINSGRKEFENSFLMDSGLIFENSEKVAKKSKRTHGITYYATGAHSGIKMNEYELIEGFEAKNLPEVTIKPVNDTVTGAFAKGTIRGLNWKEDSIYVKDKFRLPSFGVSILKHVSPVFCVPGNKELLAYYNRVDDRLYKIRNCMNIQGQRRQLALFAPEIDPRMLVRARAAGLSLDDILNSISGNLPPYRFSYILERAKAFTSVVQSFGASLLSAIEKKDTEELTLLRMSQQQNILTMASKSRKLEVDSANESIKALNERIGSLTYQIGYYQSLIAENLTLNERLQQVFKHTATGIHAAELLLGWLAGTLYLIPQAGSPFAMKYGGLDLGNSSGQFMKGVGTLATISESVSSSAGLEAGFERRYEGWKHQKKTLEYELKQTEKNLVATEIRRDILIESEKIHQKNIEHSRDMMEFYGDKFSNLGLYTWLSSTMQRLFKEAYNNAVAIARLAEQAYRFERDDNTVFIDGNYFESSKAGLLAGERLLMALQGMEKRYLETNYRKNEVDQAFSLTQLNPSALLTLKQTGSCEFSIPELFFDLFYPGQYRRKIQSVRLTIPSVTGPYTNVSATLSLTGSKIRMDAQPGSTGLKDVPLSRTTTIATSTALNDAGVFQINFRDDRYMPFEGAGAISSWKLSLPKNFRQFDYQTINDVIIHVSYMAVYDELFRDKVEAENEAVEGTLVNILKNNALARTFSFRQEFSNDFHRLTQQAVNQPVTIKIQNKHFPMFLNGRNLKITKAKLLLITPSGQTVSGVDILINGVSQTGFSKDSALGNLFAKDLGNLFNTGIIKDHTISVASGGDLAPAAPPVGHVAAMDTEKLEDMVLYVEYKLA